MNIRRGKILIIIFLFVSCRFSESDVVPKNFHEESNSLFNDNIDSVIMYCSCVDIFVDSSDVLYFPCFSAINLSKEEIIKSGFKNTYFDKESINLFKVFFDKKT